MDVTCIPELCQAQDYKILHLVRHAQAVHNVAAERSHDLLDSEDYFDAQLSSLGWDQADGLRRQVHESGLKKKIDVVITSPLLRALQTAATVFGGGSYNDKSGDPPLMVAGAGKSNGDAISSQNCPRFVAVELCRERLGDHPCDRRRSVKEYETLFPAVDFSQIESDEDILWTKDREPIKEIVARGMEFLNWLWAREEKEIAIVTHSSFLQYTLAAFCEDGEPSNSFKNCELRSLKLVERRSSGPASSVQGEDYLKFDLIDYDHVMAQGD